MRNETQTNGTKEKENKMKTKATYPKTKEDLDPNTAGNRRQEIEAVKLAVKHINEAINALADAPKMDFCSDKQAFIKDLEEMLYGDDDGAPGSGMVGLIKLLQNQTS